MNRPLVRILFTLVTAATIASVGALPAGAGQAPAASTAPAPAAAGTGGTPTTDTIRTLALTDASARRTAAATQGPAGDAAGVALQTGPIETAEFLVAGLTWSAGDDLPAGAEVYLRVREDEGWSDWLKAGIEDGYDAGVMAAEGTEPFVTGGATAVQVRVTGNPAGLPADMDLVLVSAEPGTDDVAPGAAGSHGRFSPVRLEVAPVTARTAPSAVEAALTGPLPMTTITGDDWTGLEDSVVTRAEWGANETWTDANWTPRYFPLQAAVVHHTAGTNRYEPEDSAAIVKGIFTYHTQSLGWGDIGYNFLVDKYGQVFEGRKFSLTYDVPADVPAGWMIEAGHATGFNKGSLGISAMGDFTKATAPDSTAIEAAMAQVIAWKFDAANLDAVETSGFISPTTKSTTTYAPGTGLPRIFAHDDVAQTLCPGTLYNRLDALRTAVATGYTRASDVSAPVVIASPTGGTYPEGQEISLSSDDPRARVYRTIDGAKVYFSPTLASTLYTAPLTLSGPLTLTYVAIDDAGNTSLYAPQTYSVGSPVQDTTPPEVTASPTGGAYSAGTPITLSASEAATIYYTTDGTPPTTSSPSAPNTVTLSLSADLTLSFFAVDTAGNTSALSTEVYTVGPANTAPIADAGDDPLTVKVGTRVTLDGSRSTDPEGATLTYAWTQTGGKTVTLTGATTATPTFTPKVPGTYTFRLVVHDGSLSSPPDDVVITVIR